MNSTQLANLNRLKKIASGGGGGGQVDTSYVDAQDAKTLSEAKSYTDTAVSNKADSEHSHDEYLPLGGGTMTGELRVNGGDKMGGSKIVLTSGKGQITNTGTQTLFGFTADTTLAVGHNSYILALRGNTTRPKYNSEDLAFQSDIPDLSEKANTFDLTSHTGDTTVHVTSAEKTKWNNKVDDFTISLYNGTGGNPKPVKFATVDYSQCGSENGVMVKIGMVSGHGNGVSYVFLQDAIISVSHLGAVSVDNFKYYGASTGTYDGSERQYGDIFSVLDTTSKIVDFYCLMGQYATVKMTPFKRLNSSNGGTITQHTSCTVYSGGEKAWAKNDEIATISDIPTSQVYSVNGQTETVWLTPPDVGACPADHADNMSLHITEIERGTWNSKSDFSGDYNDLRNKPTIPTVSVSSVNGMTGNVNLNHSHVGASPNIHSHNEYFLKTGGTLTGAIAVNDVASMDANGYVTGTWLRTTADTSLESRPTEGVCVKQNGWIYTRTLDQFREDIGALTAPTTYTGTLTASGWTLTGGVYVQTIAVNGVTAGSILFVGPFSGDFKMYGQYGVRGVTNSTNSILFHADEKPPEDLVVNIVKLV